MTATETAPAINKPNAEQYLTNIVVFLNDMALDESFDPTTRTRALSAGEKCQLILNGLKRAKITALRAQLKPPSKAKSPK